MKHDTPQLVHKLVNYAQLQTKKNCYPTLDIGNNEKLKTKLEFQNNEVAAQTKDMCSPQDRLVHYINGGESARRI